MLERLNQEPKRRTHVVRIFPTAASCLRLVQALAVEMHENWLEATRYLNLDRLKEHKKEARGPWPPEGGRARTALRYTGAPRRPRPTSPTPAILLNLTHTTSERAASAGL
jgi:Transposase, Mutator family